MGAMNVTRLNSCLMHWAARGKSDGPAILFANSLGTDFRLWDSVIAHLSPRYRAVTYDMRGHGLSEAPPGPYSIDSLANDVLALADVQGLKRFALVGMSVGGLIAQAVAIRAPERLNALIICDTAARIWTPDLWSARIAAVEASGLEELAGGIVKLWVTEKLRTMRPDELLGWQNMLTRQPLGGYLAMCGLLRDTDLTSAVHGIKTPTLALAGDEDASTPPALVKASAERIPGARFELIPGAGHLPCIEQPAVLARLIDRHISEANRG